MATTNFSAVIADNFKRGTAGMDFTSGVTQVTGASATISHGLTTLTRLIPSLAGATGTLANRCVAVTANGAVVYRWKNTSAATTTLIASTATSSIRWLAIGIA